MKTQNASSDTCLCVTPTSVPLIGALPTRANSLWKLKMKVSVDEKYAVAVRDGARLLLFLWIKRAATGDLYAFLPRPHCTSINAHASYLVDGKYHIKSHNMSGRNKIMYQQRQKTDQHFVGAENLLEQTITLSNARSIGHECNPTEFSEVFEISVPELETTTYVRVTSDVVSPGHSPNLVPGVRVIRQKEYRHSFPRIVLTLYEMPQF
ncbi:MAG: hypothetical protein HYX63_22395 [Gammaproteobacteria bacterium]|nr:hypothetical protein [Gammaproteobacteria bacterium]